MILKLVIAIKYVIVSISMAYFSFQNVEQKDSKLLIMENKQETIEVIDNSKKSILARGCDPVMSYNASKAIPKLIGNPEYIPTTSDADFIEKLKSRKWSVIFFAPGACRYSAARLPIPGRISETEGWTLEQYRELVKQLQGDDIQIVETQDERETVSLLKGALAKAREVK